MGTVVLELPAVLAPAAAGRRRFEVSLGDDDGAGAGPRAAQATVGAVLDAVCAPHPVLARRIRDETGSVRRYVNVFLGKENIRDLQGQLTPVDDGARIMVIQSVAGG